MSSLPTIVNALGPIAFVILLGFIAVLLGLTAVHRREMILLGAVPTAVGPMMLAVQYKVYADEAEATILISTVLSMITMGVAIALTR